MSDQYQDEEAAVQCAVEEAQAQALEGKEPNFAALAKKHGVSRPRIWRRFQGGNSKSTRPSTNRLLTDTQENALVAWIGVLDTLEISARTGLIEASANQILREAWTGEASKVPIVGKNWVKNFIDRHEELHYVRQKSRELSRMTLNWTTVNWFFIKLSNIIKKHGILPSDIWNVDEIGFRVGVGGRQWIVTLCPSRDAHIASETCRDSVTCIEAVSATGQHIAPLVILAAAQHSEAWVDNDLEDDTLFAVSPNGYTDDIIGLKWIKHFEEKTKRMTKGAKRLLIFDGHGSHCTRQFLAHCEANNILPFSLPPHSSHILQPLDVGVFQPYKHWHREAVDAATRTGCTKFTKTEFLAALHSIRVKTMQSNTIKSGFRRTGIYPLQPNEVLSKFPTPNAAPSQFPPETAASSSVPTTPQTIRSLYRVADRLESHHGEDMSPTLARFVRGALQQAQSGSLAIKALEDQTAAQQERNKRNERQRKVTQSGGILYAADARTIAKDKMDQEDRDEERRASVKWKKEIQQRKGRGWGKTLVEIRREAKRRLSRASRNQVDQVVSEPPVQI